MTITQNTVILILAVAAVTMGYFYYRSRQNVVEIKLPHISIEKR